MIDSDTDINSSHHHPKALRWGCGATFYCPLKSAVWFDAARCVQMCARQLRKQLTCRTNANLFSANDSKNCFMKDFCTWQKSVEFAISFIKYVWIKVLWLFLLPLVKQFVRGTQTYVHSRCCNSSSEVLCAVSDLFERGQSVKQPVSLQGIGPMHPASSIDSPTEKVIYLRGERSCRTAFCSLHCRVNLSARACLFVCYPTVNLALRCLEPNHQGKETRRTASCTVPHIWLWNFCYSWPSRSFEGKKKKKTHAISWHCGEEAGRGLVTSANTAGNNSRWQGKIVPGTPPTHLVKINRHLISAKGCLICVYHYTSRSFTEAKLNKTNLSLKIRSGKKPIPNDTRAESGNDERRFISLTSWPSIMEFILAKMWFIPAFTSAAFGPSSTRSLWL